jgi:hypothetical protein
MKEDRTRPTKRTLIGTGLVAAIVAFTLVSESSVQAAPPDKDVVVVNTPAQPVPVTGTVAVTGGTTVSGTVNAVQSGPWTVGIDPAHNGVSLVPGASFIHDSGFAVINDGATVDLGPFDLTNVGKLRILVRAVNGDVHVEVLANVPPAFPITLDEFTVAAEGSGSVSKSFVYDVPPPSVTVRLTESGPGGSNYHVVLIAR